MPTEESGARTLRLEQAEVDTVLAALVTRRNQLRSDADHVRDEDRADSLYELASKIANKGDAR